MFNLDLFISNNVINRKHSLFESDIESNREQLEKKFAVGVFWLLVEQEVLEVHLLKHYYLLNH